MNHNDIKIREHTGGKLMKKIKDPILLGIVSGLTGNVLKNIGVSISKKSRFGNFNYAQTAGGLFMTKRQTKTGLGNIIGRLSDAAIGAGLGVGFAYILKYTGKDHALMKGVGYGHGAWTILMGAANQFGFSNIYPMDPKSVLSNYLGHTLYGIGASLAATTFGDDDFFKKEDIEKDKNLKNI